MSRQKCSAGRFRSGRKGYLSFLWTQPGKRRIHWENCCIVNGYLAKALIPLEAYDLLCSKTQRLIDLFCQIGNLENENDFSEVLGFVDTIVDHLESAPLEYQLRVSGIGIELILGKLRKAWNSDVFKNSNRGFPSHSEKQKQRHGNRDCLRFIKNRWRFSTAFTKGMVSPVIQAERRKAAYLAGSCFSICTNLKSRSRFSMKFLKVFKICI